MKYLFFMYQKGDNAIGEIMASERIKSGLRNDEEIKYPILLVLLLFYFVVKVFK